MKTNILLTVLLTFFGANGFAQIFEYTKPTLYFTPTITLGYTFRCGWNYGFDMTVGLKRIMPTKPEINSAINTQFYIINYQGEQHKLITFNIVADSKMSQFGIGIGRIWKRWGYKKINKDAALGYSVLFNLSSNNYSYPYLAAKAFVPSAKWTWSSLPYYFSYYTFWRRTPFVVH